MATTATAPRKTTTVAKPAARPVRRTQAERSESTIGQIVRAARELFASKGFADTSIEEIVTAAGMTRGALYHHFTGKTEVFRAVFEAEQLRLAERTFAAAARKRGSAWNRLEAASLAFLEEARDPGVRQIVLIDGFAALGWNDMREIEFRYTLDNLKQGIQLAIDEGTLSRRSADCLAHLLFGAICEAAMTVARSDAPDARDREMRREVRALFSALASS